MQYLSRFALFLPDFPPFLRFRLPKIIRFQVFTPWKRIPESVDNGLLPADQQCKRTVPRHDLKLSQPLSRHPEVSFPARILAIRLQNADGR